MEKIELFDMCRELLRPKNVAPTTPKAAPLVEALGDNKVDNIVDDLARAADIELQMFSASLLNTQAKEFLQSYRTPQFEGFRAAFRAVVARYRVMDGTEQGDLFHKIEILFKDIFVQKFGALGPEAAELMSQRYSNQMVAVLKSLSVQANVDMDQGKSWY